MRDKKNIIAAVSLLCVLLVTVLVYWPGLNGPFLLDDFINIQSSYVDDFDLESLTYEVTHNKSGTLGRPVSVLSLLITGIVHGPEPWGYKFHNLAIHLINGLLIFWLLVRLLPRLSAGQNWEKNLLIAGLVSTIWLLHPLLVSTVLYSVQRMAQLSTLFILAALLVYIHAREKAAEPGIRFYLLAYLALPASVLLSILSKENGVLIPVYILAIEFIVYRFEFTSSQARNRLCWFLGFFVALPIITGATLLLTNLDRFADFSSRDFDMVERLLTQLHVVVIYLKMILLPRLSDMTLFHDYIEVTRTLDLVTGLLFLLLAGACFLVIYLRKKAPVVAFAIAWFLVSHLLESTFFSLELMFEHRNYLAAVGPLMVLVYYLFNIPSMPKLKYLAVLFLLMACGLTILRVQEWKSAEMIFQIAVTEHPDSARAQTEMANIKYNRGDLAGALEHLSMAQQNSPREFGPVLHEVAFLCNTGANIQPILDEAIARAREYPVTAYSLNSLDNLLIFLNESRCPEMSLDDLLRVVEAAEQQPGNQDGVVLVGMLEKVKGQIYMIKGDYSKSIEFAFSAYEKTGMSIILSNLARNLIQLNLYGDAEQVLLIMDNINRESGGRESALITPLRKELQTALDELESSDMQSDHQDP